MPRAKELPDVGELRRFHGIALIRSVCLCTWSI